MDEQFKKAQKPWSKLLLKVNKAKADYHAACKAEKTAVNIERNAGGDSSLSQDHVRIVILLYIRAYYDRFKRLTSDKINQNEQNCKR